MIDRILSAAQENRQTALARLQRYIKQHSVSAENDGNTEMAEMLAAEIRSLGGSAEVSPGVDFPIVYGRIDAGCDRTLLIHSMYDTTPADEPGWVTDPFAGSVMDFEDKGECIVARGAEDTKGPVAAVFSMIDAHRRAGIPLPVNLILIFEASELGSASLPPFIEAHKEELSKADVAYWPWHTERADGTGVVWLGCKGLMTFKLRVRAGEWGGPARKDIHGLNSSWIGNPIHRLVAALASLKTADDLDVAVDGFYGEGDPVTSDDEDLIDALAARLNPAAVLKELGARRFKQGDFRSAVRAHCFQSEFNISGIKGGYFAEDAHKVVIPIEAVASLDLRPLDGMSVNQVVTALREHLDRSSFPDVEIEVMNGYVGGRMPASNWAVQELIGAYRDSGFDPEIWPRTATAIAVDLFTNTLGMPWIATCPGHAGGKHSANEFLQTAGYHKATDFICRLVWRLAEAEMQDSQRSDRA